MMAPQAAHYHYANNVESRIDLARLLLKYALPFFQAHSGPFQLVTVTSTAYLVPRDEAGNVNLFSLQQLTRQALQGCDFVGMVEPGLYKDWSVHGPQLGRSVVSWHTHVVLAGKTKAEVRALARSIGGRHTSITGHAPVHVKTIRATAELEHYVLYVVKAPLKEYRLRAWRSDTADPETGEVLVRYRQSKRPMRTGDSVRLANALREGLLDDLLFGGGQGARSSRRSSRKRLPESRARKPSVSDEKV